MTPLFLQTDNPEFTQSYMPMIISSALAMTCVYLLLPRVQRYPRWSGILAGVVALLFAGWSLFRPEPILVESILFYSFAGLAVISGVVMITQTQPVRAALSFAVVVLSTCGLFLLQAAPFLMASTIIIYAGAIVVTFLFVIMLAQQSGLSDADYRSREPLLACVAGFVLLATLLCVLQRNFSDQQQSATVATINKHLEDIRAIEGEAAKPIESPEALMERIRQHISKAEEASQAKTAQEVQKIVGDGFFISAFKNIVKPLGGPPHAKNYKNDLYDKLGNVQESLFNLEDTGDNGKKDELLTLVNDQMSDIHVLGWRLQNELQNTLLPNSPLSDGTGLKLSPFSGTPPNLPPPIDETGRTAMPADNVAAVGKSLFTDYLVPVELVATLLLVATIGAIAIAGRRLEGLK